MAKSATQISLESQIATQKVFIASLTGSTALADRQNVIAAMITKRGLEAQVSAILAAEGVASRAAELTIRNNERLAHRQSTAGKGEH